MCGPQEGVLYVGKARNLRRRLSAYRVANPERLPRRIIRLLHQVTRIEFDECPDERTARHREELLIAVLSPKFNRAGKVWPLDPAWAALGGEVPAPPPATEVEAPVKRMC
jgi:excinuclease UvrABC nuclease subunit